TRYRCTVHKDRRCRFGRTDRKTLRKDVEKSPPRASKLDSEVEKFVRVARQSPPACSQPYLKAVRHDQKGSSRNPIDLESLFPMGSEAPLPDPCLVPLERYRIQEG